MKISQIYQQIKAMCREIVHPEPIAFQSIPEPEKYPLRTVPLSDEAPKRKITVTPSESEYIFLNWKNDVMVETITKQGSILIESFPRLVKIENDVVVKTITSMSFFSSLGDMEFRRDYDSEDKLMSDIREYIEIDARLHFDKPKSKAVRDEQEIEDEIGYDEEHFDLERNF